MVMSFPKQIPLTTHDHKINKHKSIFCRRAITSVNSLKNFYFSCLCYTETILHEKVLNNDGHQCK